MKIKLKKLIQVSTLVALSAATLISCSSDSEYGMLRLIANSQEEASYTISKSSFNTTGGYFVSVEADGIYKASYITDAEDEDDPDSTNNVKRELYEDTDDLTQILSIYTDEYTSYVVYVSENNETHLASFDNTDPSSSSLTEINIDSLAGTFKNLTPNGYIITTDVDTSIDEASLYIYSLAVVAGGTYDADDYLVQLSNIFSEYGEDDENGSSRYLDYCVYYDNTTKNIDTTTATAYGNSNGLIISLTDSDDDNDDYVAADRYYYFSETDLGGKFDVVGGTSTTNYNINIDADDDDDDAVNAAIVSAHGDSDGANALIITSDGNAYSGNLGDETTDLKDRWNNSDNSDTFAVHLPSLFFNDSVYDQDDPDDDDDYLIGMNSYDYIYVYYGESDDDRYSTSSDIDVAYADDLNSSSDIIYIAPVESSTSGVDTYWVATADNGYYTMKIDTANIIEDSDSHSITEGFSY